MKIKAIIFDLDGTIADTILDLANACNYVLKTPVSGSIPSINTSSW